MARTTIKDLETENAIIIDKIEIVALATTKDAIGQIGSKAKLKLREIELLASQSEEQLSIIKQQSESYASLIERITDKNPNELTENSKKKSSHRQQ